MKRLATFSLVLPVAALVACSTTSPPPAGVAPTAQSAATQAAPTVQAAAKQAAPTVQAAATQAAPTVQAAATQVAPTVQAAATQVANPPVRITDANLAADDPRITIQNTTTQAVDLTGWTLRVGASAVRLPSNTSAPAGETLTVHATTGTSSGRDVYLGQPPAMLSQELRPGARVTLEDPNGSIITAMTVPGA